MLQELRKSDFSQTWTKSEQRGRCANRDCFEEAKHACSRCGLKYCSDKCQKADWKARHKHHCEVTNLDRTKVIFNIHKQRLDDYRSGKTSFDRYYSIAKFRFFDANLPQYKKIANAGAYIVLATDEASGRILTVLEDHECEREPSIAVQRGANQYLINTMVPAIPLTEAEKQARIEAGLSVRDAVELVPINRDIQITCDARNLDILFLCMREAWLAEQDGFIESTIIPGLGCGYGNPVFLTLQNVLAYDDFLNKTFARGPFPFPTCLFCSIMFPNEFKYSMRTGNTDDDDKYLDTNSEVRFVAKYVAPPDIVAQSAVIFDYDRAVKQYETDKMVYQHAEACAKGENQEVKPHMLRYFAARRDPWTYVEFDMSTACSESLAVHPADQMCFMDRRNQPTNNSEDITLSDLSI